MRVWCTVCRKIIDSEKCGFCLLHFWDWGRDLNHLKKCTKCGREVEEELHITYAMEYKCDNCYYGAIGRAEFR